MIDRFTNTTSCFPNHSNTPDCESKPRHCPEHQSRKSNRLFVNLSLTMAYKLLPEEKNISAKKILLITMNSLLS